MNATHEGWGGGRGGEREAGVTEALRGGRGNRGALAELVRDDFDVAWQECHNGCDARG